MSVQGAQITASRPGALAPLVNVVAVTEEGSRAHAVVEGVGGRSWPEYHFTDQVAAVRHIATKGAALVVVGGASAGWLARAVHEARDATRMPIAVLGPRGQQAARPLLDEGATTVIDSHAPIDEIAARLLALGRGAAPERDLDVRWLESGVLRLDLSARRCYLGETQVSLSANEFDLLHYLMSHSLEVLEFSRITSDLWNIPDGSGINTLRLSVARLRRKLGDNPQQPEWIESVRGVGYQFRGTVAEVGQDRSDDRLRTTVAALNAQQDAMYDLIERLNAADSVGVVADTVVRWATDRAFADAATVFRFESHEDARYSRLVTSAGMSSRWRQAIAKGHRVDEGFISSAAYLRGEVIQLADMSRPGGRFPVTVSMSSAENLHACVIFPVFSNGRVWGDLGFLSRETRAFPPARARFLRAVADLVSLALSSLHPEEASDAPVR